MRQRASQQAPRPEVGSRIQVHSNHWCRARHKGVVADMMEDVNGVRYVIRFDVQGVGFDGGFYLVLCDNSFDLIHE